MDEEQIKRAQEEVESVIRAGAPIVTLDIFKILDQFTLTDQIKDEIKYTQELYTDLINKLKTYSKEDQEKFLKTLKDTDIIDNQSIEKEDSFMIALYKSFHDVYSVDLLLDVICGGKQLSKEEFIHIHDVLLYGTSSSDKLGVRDNDLKFVGSLHVTPETKYYFGNRAISYFPIRHTEIDPAIDKILDYYNHGIQTMDLNEAYLIPIILHGLIASLQLFKDGNTRYGRLFQSVLFYQLSKEQLNLDFDLPLVYASRQYAAYRNEYRKRVEDIVLENSPEAWNEWIYFNLLRIQDGLLYNYNVLDYISKVKHV